MSEVKKTENSKVSNWKKTWWAILTSEFFGTIALVLWIILPSVMAFGDPAAHKNNVNFWTGWAKIWELIFMKSLWVAGFIVGIVYLLRSISVNLNPAVTIAEIVKGNDSVNLGLMKISTQLVAGLIAGLIGFGIANAMGFWNMADNATQYHTSLDALHPRWMGYNFGGDFVYLDSTYNTITLDDMKAPATFMIASIILECLFTFLLIGSVFYFDMHKNIRPLFIGGTVWLILLVGIRTNNIALNPARLMGPALIHQMMDSAVANNGAEFVQHGYSYWVPFYLFPELLAPAIFYGLEVMNKKNEVSVETKDKSSSKKEEKAKE